MSDSLLAGEPLTILHVEDNAAHAELVRRSLENHRVINRMHHVKDGEEALDFLFRRGAYSDPRISPRPTLILLDIRLPRVSGLEVLDQIDADPDLNRIPVVMLTTSSAEADVMDAYARHVNSYVVKPLDFGKFPR